MKPLVGLVLTVGDVILFYAIRDSARTHHAHGGALTAYAVLVAASVLLWVWVLRPKAKAASRPGGYPYGGSR